MADLNLPDGDAPPPIPEVPPPRVPRTHISPAVVAAFKSLSLAGKLKKCKDIEEQNDARKLMSINHLSDPEEFPDDGSEEASIFTLDAEDIRKLKVPSFAALYHAILPSFIANYLAEEKLIEEDLKEIEKRKRDDTSKLSPEDTRIAKRRCMDGSGQVDRVRDIPAEIQFSQIMFDTEACSAIPLPLFLNSSLRHIVDEHATLPTLKSTPLPGETKGITVIDVKKLMSSLAVSELSLSHSQWEEAARNYYRFQEARDTVGQGGEWASHWDKHFTFFSRQHDRDQFYDAWKHIELELRREFFTQRQKYDPNFYATKYDLAKSEAKIKSSIENTFRSQGFGNFPKAQGNSSSPPRPRTDKHPGSFPFPSSSSKASPLTCCVLCAEAGHPLGQHGGDRLPVTKFADGKPIWARYIDNILRSPDAREVCINWNIKGASRLCTHKDGRLHNCSFCGSAAHHALSWSCRSRPALKL